MQEEEKLFSFIEKVEKKALGDKAIERSELVRLLGIDPDSEACDRLGLAARRVAAQVTGDRAYLWGAMGVDYKACPMNCDFCSLGEAWGIVEPDRERDFSEAEIIESVRDYAENKVRWIVLRTTEFYSLDVLSDLIGKIRRAVPGSYEIGLNVGEFDLEKANALHRSGVDFIYHSLRLGEGKDTRFDPEERLRTLRAVKDSPLKLVFLVEPIGIEHSDEEIVDICLCAIEHQAIVTGGMARVPVPGTPLGAHPQISESRLAQIVAVTRLAGGRRVPDICVHPATQKAMRFGANVAVVETGSIPRDSCCLPKEKWHQFDAQTAGEWFEQAGYTLCAEPEMTCEKGEENEI
ncbi:radical SAM protein [Eubacterium sp. 1001713B170207_170306_E7]|uniref:radical SAM protein n=1 Tax=Eubacterium sp. 1001713B170207_170306_E7 TaxID=2787097 RepID=UPI001FAB6CC9|nr:radical SAM protein [Eubacterium sp. 1001713B170207_170306_E7]